MRNVIYYCVDLVFYAIHLIVNTFKYHDTLTKPHKLEKTDKIVILGNGPSALKFFQNIDRFNGYSLLCVNFLAIKNKEFFFQSKPRYYCLIDPVIFASNKNNLSIYMSKSQKKDVHDLFDTFEKVNWEMHIITFCNYNVKIDNKNVKFIRINNNVINRYNKLTYYLYKQNFAVPTCMNVLNAALYFAIIFKYKKIAIFGADFNFILNMRIDENNFLLYDDVHFSSVKKRNLTKEFRHGSRSINNDFCNELECMKIAISSFDILSKLAINEKCEVLNYCKTSFINSFKKVEL